MRLIRNHVCGTFTAGFAMLLVAGARAADGTPDAPPFDSRQFQQFWGDNKAELAGYELTTSRYGQARKGVAVTIVVTEPFSNSARVKADPGKHPREDEFPALKLNLIEDF